MSDGIKGGLPAVGDKVWVDTSGTSEYLATVVDIAAEMGEDSYVLVKYEDSNYEAFVSPSDISRPFLPSSPRKTRSQRPLVTPSPAGSTEAGETKARAKRKHANLAKPATDKNKTTSPHFDKKKKAPAAKKKKSTEPTSMQRKSVAKKEEPASKTMAPTKKPAAAVNKKVAKKAPSEEVPVAMDTDSDNGFSSEGEDNDLDRPFKIEYSTTGRATCKRCDEKIAKGAIRVSHIPLFRGKPGFKVYRHLHCAVFSEEVVTAKDVGGFKKLNKKDFKLLVERVEESKIEIQKENEELHPDELVNVGFQGEMRSPPPGLTATMLPFQVEGSSWMFHQEVNVPEARGGILADDMGMGKTVQGLGVILDNRPLLQHCKPGCKHSPSSPDLTERMAEDKLWDESLTEWKQEMDLIDVPKHLIPKPRGKQPGGGARAGTLVVCPMIALSQWKSEIEKFTENGTLTVGIYHGPKRSSETPRELLLKYDVVLTTYQVLEHDFRKMTSPNKVKCPNCGGKYKIDKLRVHLKYFCGEGAERTEAQSRQRRSRDQGRGGGPRRGGTGNAKGSKKKTFAPKKAPPKAKAKKIIRVKSNKDYDSESDLSVASEDEDDVVSATPARRPSRAAAVSATKQLSKSKAEWVEKATGTDSDDYGSDDEDSSDEDSSDEESVVSECNTKHPVKKKAKLAESESESGSSESESEDESDSEEDERLKRAREKQALALAKAKKGKPTKKKNLSNKAKGGKKKAATGNKRKKFDDDSNSSDEDYGRDPMEGIDMDRLIEEAMEGSQMSVLHSVCWWRIILDEAHVIKSRSSGTANAAFSLIGIHRWCLSGTPLQNRVGELYSLIRFLRIDPMAHYFCRAKDCDCKSLHYRMLNGKCKGCGHSSVQHFSHFNKFVLNPIKSYGYTGDGRRAMFKLKEDVLDKSLLRRTKETKAEDLNLPPRLVTISKVRLHPVEEDFYNALYTQTQSSFNDYVDEGTLLNNYAHIFDLLMRMRQAVDHPYLVVYSKRDSVRQDAARAGQAAIANGSVDCDLCHEPPTDRVLSSCCQAAFCRGCVVDYMSSLLSGSDDSNTPCPSCQQPFSIDLNQASTSIVDDETLVASRGSSEGMPSLKDLPHVATGSILRRINLAEYATSSKIEALCEELVKMRKTSPGSKAIVFSQFVSMIDLIRWRLHSDPCLANMGLGVRALHGSMDVKARDASLKEFREDGSVRVLLMSLKAGGVALNLTVANHIYLMDPWWNPAAEMQAIDRTHRLGQYRPIRAVRFIAENTVEERILQLQEKKRLVFDGTVGRDAGSLKMLTVDDMKSLFA